MRLKAVIPILLFLSITPVSYAGERDRWSLSLTPSINGGLTGIKSAPSSPLAYNGSSAGVGLRLSAHGKTVDCFMDCAYSFGWLGNVYRRDPKSMFSSRGDLSVGGMTGIFDNGIVSMKAGAALGGLWEIYVNRPIDCYLHALAVDARACISVGLNLPRRFSITVEDQIPFGAFIATVNRFDVLAFNPDYSLKAFPGNSLKVGVSRTLNGRNSLMLILRHYCYSSGGALPNIFRLQFFELGFAFRFDLTKLYEDDL